MLNRTVVVEWFAILCDRFNKEPLTPVVFDLYVEAIEEDIATTEEFVFACKKVFKHNKFFPTPGEFALAIGRSPQMKALEEMAYIWNVATGSDSLDLDVISPAAREALRVCGGMRRLRFSDEKERPFLENRFLEVWQAKEHLNHQPEEILATPIGLIEPGLENAAAYRLYSPPPTEVAFVEAKEIAF